MNEVAERATPLPEPTPANPHPQFAGIAPPPEDPPVPPAVEGEPEEPTVEQALDAALQEMATALNKVVACFRVACQQRNQLAERLQVVEPKLVAVHEALYAAQADAAPDQTVVEG